MQALRPSVVFYDDNIWPGTTPQLVASLDRCRTLIGGIWDTSLCRTARPASRSTPLLPCKPTRTFNAGKPLVALLAPAEPHHRWATEVLRVKARVLTCEAVLSEAFLLLRGSDKASRALRAMVADAAIELAPLTSEGRPTTKLMDRYSSVPMSFADACLVRLSELIPRVVVATLDSNFVVYRRNGRQVIPLLMP